MIRSDPVSQEIIVTAEEPPHAGGILEQDGVVLGLLSPPESGETASRAVAVHRLLPWIETMLAAPRPHASSPAPAPEPETPSAAYRTLLQRVREHVRDLLKNPELAPIRRRWGADPLAELDLDRPSVGLNDLLDGLEIATRESLNREWSGPREQRPAGLREACQRLYAELVKLAVDPQSVKGCGDLDALIQSGPGRLHVVCELEVTAGVIYAATRDLTPSFYRDDQDGRPLYEHAVYFPSEIAYGVGEDQRQDLLKKLWWMLIDDQRAEIPDRIEGRALQQLIKAIAMRLRRRQRHYLLIAPGTEDQLHGGGYASWAKDLGIGLVLYEEGDCPHLLDLEGSLKDGLRDYLELLESF